ncbi:MAG: Nif3-like dinuclear metal center hexameric protein [Pseudomonadota bacterium]
MRRQELEKYLATYLQVDRYADDGVNGLQIEGKSEIRRIAVAVSVCAEVIAGAAAARADALLVHHGIIWRGDWPLTVTGVLRGRIKSLLDSDCSLFAYHLPLDAHPEVGNNAVAARALGLTGLEPFAEYHGTAIGYRGAMPFPISRHEFKEKLESYYGHRAFMVAAGTEMLTRIGVVSGGAAREVKYAAALNLDAYVTGEAGEPTTHYCREAGVSFFAMGHYATERIGVRALAAHLESRLGLETIFLEAENEA